MSARVRIVTAAAWRSGPWANGGGTTHEIARWPDDPALPAAALHARLSLAEIDRPGPFSRFPGTQRWLAVVDDGGGLALELSGTRTLRAGDALAFAGDAPVTADPRGRALVCNLIARRGVAWTARVATAAEAFTAAAPAVALLAAAAPLALAIDGTRVELPARATAIVTADAPVTIGHAATPAAPAIVVTLDPSALQHAVALDGRALADHDALHDQLAASLGFPASYGRNLDALIDLLTYLDEPGTAAVAPGGLVVLDVVHAAAADPGVLAALTDVAAFVNHRRRERGHTAIVALSFDREAS